MNFQELGFVTVPKFGQTFNRNRLYSSDDLLEDSGIPDGDLPNYFEMGADENSDLPKERMDLSVNIVTICGRIGFISTPYTLDNGVQCLRLAVATSERLRSGAVRTEWHKVKLYGGRNVDYIASNARVGDRVMCVGSLKYRMLPQNSENESRYATKIAEISVSTGSGRQTLIIMPRNTFGNIHNSNEMI
ncbi:bifunctional Primosome PriB-single-strand DNA-binding/Nucleic acid-binding [Babesia duncani]|uniref:Bifunctional Primosome PriB-single-strand DNA-binding/Nucleic acid-binding n=1 Tax=Babesia duncani TaxID=323732 RepID=A0AAD9UNA0_9APIC|nr:bifunctional Primosome PriB-single-strand DNA-binding/Nucleic acid-binding [Babesia duncani]